MFQLSGEVQAKGIHCMELNKHPSFLHPREFCKMSKTNLNLAIIQKRKVLTKTQTISCDFFNLKIKQVKQSD